VDANTSGSTTSAVGSTSVGSQDQQPTSTGFSQDRGTISALFGLNGGSFTSSSISSHPWKLKWWILFCETKFNHPPAQGPNCLLQLRLFANFAYNRVPMSECKMFWVSLLQAAVISLICAASFHCKRQVCHHHL
jgi:hypothetical protein